MWIWLCFIGQPKNLCIVSQPTLVPVSALVKLPENTFHCRDTLISHTAQHFIKPQHSSFHMEKLYSKSIFSLSHFLSHTTLSPFDSTSSTQLQDQLLKPDDAGTLLHAPQANSSQTNTNTNTNTIASTSTSESSERQANPATNTTQPQTSLRCNACSTLFEDVKDQHAHYKSSWHAYSLLYSSLSSPLRLTQV